MRQARKTKPIRKREREKKQALFKIYLVLVRLTGNKEHILYIWVWFFFVYIENSHTQQTQSLKEKELNDDHTFWSNLFKAKQPSIQNLGVKTVYKRGKPQQTNTQLLKVIDIVLNYSATKQQNQLLILLTDNNRDM